MIIHNGCATPAEYQRDAEETCCDMFLFGETNDIECNGVVTKCKACPVEICEAHSCAGLCNQCVREFVLRIACTSCGLGCMYDGLCGCPSVEPMTLAALDVCLCLDGASV